MLTNCAEIGVHGYTSASPIAAKNTLGSKVGKGIRREIRGRGEWKMIRYLCIGCTEPRSEVINHKEQTWGISSFCGARGALIAEILHESLALPEQWRFQATAADIDQSFAQIEVYSGRRIEEKAFLHGLATKPETNDRLIYYRRTCSEHVHRDGTIANNNTCNPSIVKINMPIELW